MNINIHQHERTTRGRQELIQFDHVKQVCEGFLKINILEKIVTANGKTMAASLFLCFVLSFFFFFFFYNV